MKEIYAQTSITMLKQLLQKRFLFQLRNNDYLRPLCVVGHKGIGKTESIKQFTENFSDVIKQDKELVEKYKIDEKTCVNFYCLNLSTIEPPDFQGLSYEKNGKTYFGRPFWYPDENDFAVVLFNEANRQNKDIRNAMMSILQQRNINGHKFSNKTLFILDQNPSDSEESIYETVEFDQAQIGRMAFVELKPTVIEFIEYMKSKYENGIIAEWINNNEKIIDFSGISKTDPRSLEYAQKAILSLTKEEREDKNLFFIQVSSEIGTQATKVLMTFIEETMTINAKNIIDNFSKHKKELTKYALNSRKDLVIELSKGVVDILFNEYNTIMLEKEKIENIIKFFEFLDIEEFVSVMLYAKDIFENPKLNKQILKQNIENLEAFELKMKNISSIINERYTRINENNIEKYINELNNK